MLLVVYRYLRGEAEKSSCVMRDVGNVMIDTEITFEYGIRTKSHDHRGIVYVSMCMYLQVNSVFPQRAEG